MSGTARRPSAVHPAAPPRRPPRPGSRALAGLVASLLASSLVACSDATDRAGSATTAGPTDSTTSTSSTTSTTTTVPPTRTRTTAAPPPTRSRAATSSPRVTTKPSPKPSPKLAPKPSPRPSPKPAPRPPSSSGVAAQVLSLVNSERARAGCASVRTSSALQTAAQRHRADMAARDYFSHTSQDGRTFADRIRAAGYRGGTIGENIAAGQATASAVMRSWMSSSGHRANILNCAFTSLGVGHATGGSYGHYWTQDFGG